MKISKKQLKQIIKEELMKESSDPLATIESAADTLIKDGKEMEGWPSHIPASYVAEWCVEMGEKIKKAVYDIDAEEGRNPGGTIGEDANAEQARLQQRAAIRRFETELESVISAAYYAGIPKEDISEILKVFAGSV